MLTSHHLSLVRLALDTNIIEPAFQVTDKQILYFPGMSNDSGLHKRTASALPDQHPSDMTLPPPAYITPEACLTKLLSAEDVLQYDLGCGMMFCNRRQWAKALAAFERVVTHPTREGGVSKFMTDAYNKWVLVSLLVHGRTPATPSTVGSNARKMFETTGKPYLAIAAHFDISAPLLLKQEIEENMQVWEIDRNMGLVQEVLASHQKWQIMGFKMVYSKVALFDIRVATCSAETGAKLPTDDDVETLVRGMISSGMLNGEIVTSPGKPAYLNFLSDAEELSEEEYHRELGVLLARVKDLENVYKTTNARLSANSDYLKHYIREQRMREKNAGANERQTLDTMVDDEDLMAGITSSGL